MYYRVNVEKKKKNDSVRVDIPCTHLIQLVGNKKSDILSYVMKLKITSLKL